MKKALLIIDYIKGIAETGSCAAYLAAHPAVIRNTNALIQQARQQQRLIVHVRLAFAADYAGLPQYAPSAAAIRAQQKFQLGSPDTAFIAAIDYQAGDVVVNKKYGDPFYGSGLHEVLQSHGVDGVILTGVATDNAILHGSNSAIELGYHVTLVSDACGAPTAQAHEAALTLMTGRTVNDVVLTDALCQRGF